MCHVLDGGSQKKTECVMFSMVAHRRRRNVSCSRWWPTEEDGMCHVLDGGPHKKTECVMFSMVAQRRRRNVSCSRWWSKEEDGMCHVLDGGPKKKTECVMFSMVAQRRRRNVSCSRWWPKEEDGMCHVLDGGSLIQRMPWNRDATFYSICHTYVDYVQRKYNKSVCSMVPMQGHQQKIRHICGEQRVLSVPR